MKRFFHLHKIVCCGPYASGCPGSFACAVHGRWDAGCGTAFSGSSMDEPLDGLGVERALGERFGRVRGFLKTVLPHWRLGRSYQGWCDAVQRWLLPLQAAVAQRLRRQMQTLAGRHCWQAARHSPPLPWMARGWNVRAPRPMKS